jgi:hypothetical protein
MMRNFIVYHMTMYHMTMYVLKPKPQNSIPHSSQTDEPRTTKIGRYNFGPDLTPCVKVGLGRLMRVGATKPQFYIDLRGFPQFFFSFEPNIYQKE